MISERIDTWKEEWKRQGAQEGRQEGRQEGLLQGQADALLRLLARRFGPVPEQAASRVRAAGLPQLERWFDCAVDAASLEQVFTEH